MKLIGKLFIFPILAINIIVNILTLLSCYGSYIKPIGSLAFASLAELAFPFLIVSNLLFFFFWLIIWHKGTTLSIMTLFICIPGCLQYCPIHIFENRTKCIDGEIKILSYNTEGFGIRINKDSSIDNPILQYLSSSNADIICVQEANQRMMGILKSENGYLSAYPYAYLGNGTSGLACFSRYPIISHLIIDFGEDTNNSCCYLRLLYESDTIALYNCHLQSNGLKDKEIEEYLSFIENPSDDSHYLGSKSVLKKLLSSTKRRVDQADMIASIISKETAKYIIVCGDFNDTPISYAHRRIKRNLDDSFIKRGTGLGVTYNRYNLLYRIDHIMTSRNLKPMSCWVDRTIKDSDHFPIVSILCPK